MARRAGRAFFSCAFRPAVQAAAVAPPPAHLRALSLLCALLTWRQVTEDTIELKGGESMKYGVCVWSAGNAPRPLVQQLAQQIPEQAQFQPGGRPSKLAVDPFLRRAGGTGFCAQPRWYVSVAMAVR